MDRPATSKSRGTCRYYTTPRGCFAGDKCKFTHADPQQVVAAAIPVLTPYDRAKKCKYFANGFCKRGENCWFLHVSDPAMEADPEQDELCSICFEKPVTFGLLAGCSHVFCVKCIRQWRDPAGKAGDMLESGNTKKCPMCRTVSRFITPSSKFWKEGREGKVKAMDAYKESMARVPCKYFQQSKTKNPIKPLCPFGSDCFYQHMNDDGSKYMFKNGVDPSMRVFRNRATFDTSTGGIGLSFQSNIPPSEAGLEDAILASNIALGMLGSLIESVRNIDREEGPGRSGREAPRVGETRGPTEERDGMTFDQARIQMVAGTIAALRAELNRLERSDDTVRHIVNHVFSRRERSWRGRGRGRVSVQLRPMVAGTLAPQVWDLDGMDGMDGAGVRNGLGWNDMFSEVDEDPGHAMERLEVIAGQVLSSLQDLSLGRENLSRGHIPLHLQSTPTPADLEEREHDRRADTLPPLERLSFQAEDTNGTSNSLNTNEGADNLPSLQSVSRSSDSEDGDEVSLDQSATTFEGDIRPAEEDHERTRRWPLLHLLSSALQTSETSATASTSRISDESSAVSMTSSGSRFSTAVDREEPMMIIDDDKNKGKDEEIGNQEGSEDDVDEELVISPRAPSPTISEPPFVTDGRGRVVWSSSAANKATDYVSHTSPISRSDPTAVPCLPSSLLVSRPLLANQSPDISQVLPHGGFTTDGRGRVINIGSNDEELFRSNLIPATPAQVPPRSFLGRMFDALF